MNRYELVVKVPAARILCNIAGEVHHTSNQTLYYYDLIYNKAVKPIITLLF